MRRRLAVHHDRLQLDPFFSVEAFLFADVIDEARDVRRSGYMNLRFVQSKGGAVVT